jgi:hypothetical protein
MAVDIFEMLVDILKINQNLVNEYSSQGPLYQLFYLFFFPMVFIIVFIYLLSNAVMKEHKGLRILISVGILAFIILQGYYSWFVTISKFWFFGLIFLGFFYFIVARRGGGAKGMTLGSEKGGSAIHFVEELTGKSLNPMKALEYRQKAERTLKKLLQRKNVLEDRIRQVKHDPKAAEQVFMQVGEVDQAIALISEFIKSGAWHDYEDWVKINSSRFGL